VKKLIAGSLILAVMLPIAFMTGCGSSNSPTSTNATSTPTTVPATATSTATIVPAGPAALSLGSALTSNFTVLAGELSGGYITDSAETIYGNLGVGNGGAETTSTPLALFVGANASNPYLTASNATLISALAAIYGTGVGGTGGAYNNAENNVLPSAISETFAGSGTTSLAPGIYSVTANSVAGTNLTLENAAGNPNNAYVFFATNFQTGANTTMTLHNVKAANVFWVITGYMDLGADSTFAGNILSGGYVDFGFNVAMEGRVFANNYIDFTGTGTGTNGVDSITTP